jgi:DNA-binding response OmpR family regulator
MTQRDVPAPAPATSAATAAASSPKCRTLIVEHDPVSLRALAMVLRGAGFGPLTAATLADAMAKLDILASGAPGPRCVLLDLMLPDGCGTTLLQSIRDRQLRIRAAVVTKADGSLLLQRARSLGADDVFQKPLDPANVLAWLEASVAAE